jgi:hypothetical protein
LIRIGGGAELLQVHSRQLALLVAAQQLAERPGGLWPSGGAWLTAPQPCRLSSYVFVLHVASKSALWIWIDGDLRIVSA